MIGRRIWRLRTAASPAPYATAPASLIDELLATRLPDRAEREQFLTPTLDKLPSPDGLRDITQAVDLLRAHMQSGVIGVCGDYDADGVCATALAVRCLRAWGARVVWVVPDRFGDGYGLTPGLVDILRAQGATLVLTADNGLRAHEAIAHARQSGLAVVVTDHHSPDDHVPLADAVVNPNRNDDHSGLGMLCGTGVLYYVMIALRARMRQAGLEGGNLNLATHLDLVAVATVADVVPLIGVNRILVAQGLRRMQTTPMPWLVALCGVTHLAVSDLRSRDLAMRIIPRLNVAGRLQHARHAVDLLLCDDPAQAAVRAAQLDGWNAERSEIERQIVRSAGQVYARDVQGIPCVAAQPDWHQGVVGIAASRLTAQIHAPAVLGCVIAGDRAVCSARSVRGFDVLGSLTQQSHLYDKFGGHPQAAGLTVKLEHLPVIRQQLQADFAAQFPHGYDEPLDVDCLLDSAPSDQHSEVQNLLEPCGAANEAPVWGVLNARVRSQAIVGRNHLRFTLSVGERQAPLACIAWNRRDLYPLPVNAVCVAGHLRPNSRSGTLELDVADVQPGGDPFLPRRSR